MITTGLGVVDEQDQPLTGGFSTTRSSAPTRTTAGRTGSPTRPVGKPINTTGGSGITQGPAWSGYSVPTVPGVATATAEARHDGSLPFQEERERLPAPAKLRLWREAADGLRHVHVDVGLMGGQPVFVDTRIPISTVLGYLSRGWDAARIVDEFEGRIGPEQVKEALGFAAKLTR